MNLEEALSDDDREELEDAITESERSKTKWGDKL